MTRGARLICSALAAGLAAPFAGCAHRGEPPGPAVAAFGAALQRGDYRAAYALTSTSLRRRMDYQTFAARFAADPAAAKDLGLRLDVEAQRLPARIDVTLALGETVPLVLEDGHWRLDGPVLDPWGQETPRAALRTFIRALAERRYDVMLRLVPDRYRGNLSADKLRRYWEDERKTDRAALLARLRAAANAAIVEAGDEAHMPYGGDAELRFVREDGVWKIEEPD